MPTAGGRFNLNGATPLIPFMLGDSEAGVKCEAAVGAWLLS